MRQHRVVATEAGLLLNVLARELPLLPERAFREALKKRDVVINGVRASENARVSPGDEVLLYTLHELAEIPVLYEDGQLLIVNKPAGVNTDGNARSGFSLLAWAAGRSEGTYAPQLVHRLDNRTSGLVVLAKDMGTAELLTSALRGHRIEKVYQCLVRGVITPPDATVSAWLVKDAMRARVDIYPGSRPGAKRIVTQYSTLYSGETSRLRVVLHTGRTHQIRAHLAFLGHPVIGDDLYGDREFNRTHGRKGLMLCACELAFPEGFEVSCLGGRRFYINPPF